MWRLHGILVNSQGTYVLRSLLAPHFCFRWIMSACISSCIPVMLFFFPIRPNFAIAWCSYKISPTISVPSGHNAGSRVSQTQMKSDLLTRLDPHVLQLSSGHHSQHPPGAPCLSTWWSSFIVSPFISHSSLLIATFPPTSNYFHSIFRLTTHLWVLSSDPDPEPSLKSFKGNHKISVESIHSYFFFLNIDNIKH